MRKVLFATFIILISLLSVRLVLFDLSLVWYIIIVSPAIFMYAIAERALRKAGAG